MSPFLNRIQLSELLQQQFAYCRRHHPQDPFWGNAYDLFELANNLYQPKSPDRYTVLQKWLEPENAGKESCRKKLTIKKKINGIYLDPDQIDKYLSGDYLFEHEYNDDKAFAEAERITIIEKPGLLFYLLARVSEMDESDIITAFYAGEGLELSEYETYCVYDVVEYYFTKIGQTQEHFCKSLAMDGLSSSTFSKLLKRDEDITLRQFSKLAEPLQIPEKWKHFCMCRLAHKEDPFSYATGYIDSLEDCIEEPEYLAELIQQDAKNNNNKISGTVSQLYDYLNYTVLGLPPSWPDRESSNDMAALKVIKPIKKKNSKNDDRKQQEDVYTLNLCDYRDILDEVAAYAEFALDYMIRQKEG